MLSLCCIAQAERQAINTKVQGSAADIAKKAMVNIEERIRYEFPTTGIIPNTNYSRKLRSTSRETQQRGGYLVLQLHDELLYEVCARQHLSHSTTYDHENIGF